MLFGCLALGGILAGAAYTDIASRRIPNRLIVAGLCAFLLLACRLCLRQEMRLLAGCVKAGALAFATHLPLYQRKVMGAGDVKLALVVGLLLGWQHWLGYLYAFSAAALVVSGILLCRGNKKTKTLPMAPLMLAAYLIYMFTGLVRFSGI